MVEQKHACLRAVRKTLYFSGEAHDAHIVMSYDRVSTPDSQLEVTSEHKRGFPVLVRTDGQRLWLRRTVCLRQ